MRKLASAAVALAIAAMLSAAPVSQAQAGGGKAYKVGKCHHIDIFCWLFHHKRTGKRWVWHRSRTTKRHHFWLFHHRKRK